MVLAAIPTVSGGFIVPLALDARLLRNVLAALPTETLRAELRRRSDDTPASFRSVAMIDELDRRGYTSYRRDVDIQIGSVCLDATNLTVTWRGRTIGLSSREYDVLACLASRHPDPLTSAGILMAVWGEEGAAGSVQTYLTYLRKKSPGLLCVQRRGGGGNIKLYGLNTEAT